MAITPTQKIFGNIAALIGTLQGLTWGALSLACLIVYHSEEVIKVEESTFSNLLNNEIYKYYLNKTLVYKNRVIGPKDFNIIMWFYFFISVVLTAASIDLFFAIRQNKKKQSTLMILWGVIVIIISLIDLIFSLLLLRDFNNCPLVQTYCFIVTGVIMTLAARGYVLWFFNLCLSCFSIKNALQIITRDKVLSAVEDLSIPRAKVQSAPSTPISFPYHNQQTQQNPYGESSGFNPNPDYPSFVRSGNKKFNY